MKRLLFVLFIATFALFATAQNQPSTGIIEGRIVHENSTDPIPDALVTLTPAGAPALSPEAAAAQARQVETLRRNNMIAGVAREDVTAAIASLSGNTGTPVFVLTDRAGHFTFKDVQPGRYTIRGERDGHMAPRVNESYQTGFVKTITVKANEKPDPIEMILIPPGVMSGRVFDPQGQPAANVSVNAYRVIISATGGESWFAGRAITTNDRGEYRLTGIPPGGLWICATPQRTGAQAAWERTLYGDVTTPETATRIKVVTGGEVTNLDIHLKAKTGALFKITGTAINPFATPNPNTGVTDRSIGTFRLVNRQTSVLPEGNPNVPNVIPVAGRANGEFEIRDVRPGSYDLVATVTNPTTREQMFGKTPVEVRAGDVSGVTLVISQGATLNGQVEVRGAQAAAIKPDSVTIRLQGVGPIGNGGQPLRPDATGRFSRERVPEDQYRVQAVGLPPTAYIADIRYASATVFDSGFTLDSRPSLLEVIVNSDGQTLKGIVVSKKGEPIAAATVALVPPEAQRQNAVRFKQTTTNDSGAFTIQGVAPGQYTVYAWENIYNGAWMNARYLEHYIGQGRPLTINTTAPADLRLEAIPTENYLELWAR